MELTCNLFMGVCAYQHTCSFQKSNFYREKGADLFRKPINYPPPLKNLT